MHKGSRQQAVLDLLREGPVASQEELQRRLKKRGFEVGQATLSRDIRALGLVKTAQGYVLPQEGGDFDPALPPASRLVREFVLQVRAAQNLLVIKTSVGSAQPVAAALDDEDWAESIGTIAGDDTILIICPDNTAAKRLEKRIQEMVG